MQQLFEIKATLQAFMDSGGPVLWILFLLSLLLWSLIIERYWYFTWGYPHRLAEIQKEWWARRERVSWFAAKVRLAMIADVKLQLHRYLLLIKSLIAVCPLLGLLGTVTGMVHVFDVMALLGNGNARGMADGVSLATVPTMAGMVIALSGLFFSSHLERRAVLETQKAADSLRANPGKNHA